MHKKLFIPGPIDVLPELLDEMAKPIIGHRSKEASNMQGEICKKIQQLMYTKNQILLSTSSGTGLMEGAVRSFTKKRCAVFSIGAFGDRWHKICVQNGIPVDVFKSELGEITTPEMVDEVLKTGKYDVITITHNETSTGVANPLKELSNVIKKYDVIWLVDAVSSLGGDKVMVDDLGIDVCITSTQKCIGLPPGMSFCSVSERSIEYAKTVEHRGLYFDYVELYKFATEKNQYPSTPSISHMYALDKQLDRILQGGLDARFELHERRAKRVQEFARKHFELFADQNYLSKTVTCINNTKSFSVANLNKYLGEHGFVISNGYGPLKEKTFRISHMGDQSMKDLETLLGLIEAYQEGESK